MSVAGPLLGAAIAVGCAIILRGRGGDPISRAAGSGVLTGDLAEKAKLSQEIDEGQTRRRIHACGRCGARLVGLPRDAQLV